MNLIARVATEVDIPIIKEIIDSHQLSLNAREKKVGESEIKEMLRGFVDSSITQLTKSADSDQWQSFITLNPDNNRSRFYLDIYTLPGARTHSDSLALAIKLAKESNPSFNLWLGVNALDKDFKSLLESKGFSILRKYHTMEVNLVDVGAAEEDSMKTIRLINPDNESDLRICWELHQDSFSEHFGFVPSKFEKWAELYKRDIPEFKNRAWVLSYEGVPAGFIDCDESLAHEHAGYVHTLGVSKSFRGKGLGEALLQHAIKFYFELGRSKLCLNVDSGNESGALRLYEKVGMKPISEWHQYENLNWSSLED